MGQNDDPVASQTRCRVLIVEDEYFLADDIGRELRSTGAVVVGPIADLREAQVQVANDGFDVAVIDINLRDHLAWDVADELKRRCIPFIFVTGYGAEVIPERFAGVVRFEKPCDLSKVTAHVSQLCRKELGAHCHSGDYRKDQSVAR
jgi:DNA-binding NtrC family response regulator